MNVSGSGRVAAGEYNEKISISGSGKIDGNIRCNGLSCSGSVHSAGNVECLENVSISGSARFDKSIIAKSVSVSGSTRVDGDIKASGSVKISGATKCGGSIACSLLSSSGSVEIGGEAEADEISISGRITCAGLMNAEKISISLEGFNAPGKIGSIGGSEIRIYNSRNGAKINRMPLLKRIVGGDGMLTVDDSIEGDLIALECVKVQRVVGRIVAIGANCDVELVQYSEEIEIDPNARIGKYEKI